MTTILRAVLTAALLIPVWLNEHHAVALLLSLIALRLELDEIGWKRLYRSADLKAFKQQRQEHEERKKRVTEAIADGARRRGW